MLVRGSLTWRTPFMAIFSRFVGVERGATAIEYAVIAAS
jgi:hypothetical protein